MEKTGSQKIKEYNCRIDLAIIEEKLKAMGYDFTIHDERDYFIYSIARKDDIRYLAFEIARERGGFILDYEIEGGQIVYNTKGEILLDCVKSSGFGRTIPFGYNEYFYEIDPSKIFVGDKLLISSGIDSSHPYKTQGYDIYVLRNGKYRMARKSFCEDANIIKSSKGEILLNEHGRLFNVTKMQKLNTPKFEIIIGMDNIDEFKPMGSFVYYEKIIESIKQIISQKNLLLGCNLVFSETYCESADSYVFVDTDGNIASNFYLSHPNMFKSFQVNKANYSKVYYRCINLIEEYVEAERKRAEEIEAQEEIRKQLQSDEASKGMIEALDTMNKGVSRKLKPEEK